LGSYWIFFDVLENSIGVGSVEGAIKIQAAFIIRADFLSANLLFHIGKNSPK
jgi:hypothetical protein